MLRHAAPRGLALALALALRAPARAFAAALADPVESQLAAIYAGLPDVHDLPADEILAVEASGGHEAYGELTPAGVREVLARLGASAGDVLADLGSGCGRMVLQCALESPWLRAVGVELSPTRHRVAVEARRQCERMAGAHTARRITLLEGDMLSPQLAGALDDATIVYVASLLFDDSFMQRLGRMLAERPRVRAIATLSRFPSGALPGFREDESNFPPDEQVLDRRVEVTWGAARVYLYHKVDESLKSQSKQSE
ncbi:hypothetical protein AB1Y20_006864 [Prymnesium parvum]|uniref:Histone-lysine N-methyltransferase, H3 lysine-79 specific n=1 Tax=Prymnesium parvum TaxID=97485 RepID=A0AB34J1J6_PRYPA